MKRTILLVAVFLSLTARVFALDLPVFRGFVNDYAGILSEETIQNLEQTLSQFEKETSNEIVVVTVPSLQETTIEDFAEKLFQNWGIGKERRDNGVLILMAPNERLVKFETGYGLEGALPDILAGRIIREEMAPYFKEGNYAVGILRGVDAAMKATKGEYQPIVNSQEEAATSAFLFLAGFVFAVVGLMYIASFLARSKSWWFGGVFGGAGGMIFGFIVTTIFGAFLFGLFFGGLGLLFDFVLSKNYANRKKHGKPTDFWHSGGGFSGGSSGLGGGFFGGGGSSGSGGFGGFGGGSSGGGGASGRW